MKALKEIISGLEGCAEWTTEKFDRTILSSPEYSEPFKEKTHQFIDCIFKKTENPFYDPEIVLKGMFISFNRNQVWKIIKLLYRTVLEFIKETEKNREKSSRLLDFITAYDDFEEKIRIKYSFSSSELVKNIAENSSIIFLIKEHKQNWPVKYISSNISNLGYSVEDFLTGRKKYEDLIHKEDIDRIIYMTSYFNKEEKNYFTLNYRVLTSANEIRWFEDRTVINRNEKGEVEYYQSLLIDVTESTIAQSELFLKNRALEVAANGIMICDVNKKIVWINSSFSNLTGYRKTDLINKSPDVIIDEFEKDYSIAKMWEILSAGEVWEGEYSSFHKFGGLRRHETVITPVTDQNGNLSHFIWIISDITDKKKLDDERKMMETQLRHSQKMEAIGQLAAGIAHEINTPIQFIGDNLSFLENVFDEFSSLLYKTTDLANEIPNASKFKDCFDKLKEEIDLDYIQSEIPNALNQSADGIKRVATIVKAMKQFAHPSGQKKELNDVKNLLENTSIVARNEWKYYTDLFISGEDNLPMIPCFADELNQVFLNMIVNSAHSIKEKFEGSYKKGTILINLRTENSWLLIEIKDNGKGIPEEIINKIYDPFFTTKEVGRGTGQGLAIAHSIIVEKHCGKIEVSSEVNVGTTFSIYLPLENPEKEIYETVT